MSAAVRAGAASAALAWLAYASNQRSTAPIVVLLGGLVLLALSAALLEWLLRPGALTLLGAGIAVVAVWLLTQRNDVGSFLMLSAFFGAGAARTASSDTALWPTTDRARRAGAIVGGLGILVVTALRSSQSNHALLWCAALSVIATGIVTRVTRPASTQPARHGREWLVGGVLVTVVAVTTAYFGASTVSASWFGGGVTHGNRASRMVALTFDDGPNEAATLPLMRILDDHGVKGTFFVVGKALDADPSIVRALVDDGQLVGNHSYHHDQWRWLDPRYPELARTQDAFKRHNLPCPAWYRPPHGQRTPFTARAVRDHHMRMVLWDTAAGDWATNDAALVARRVLARVRGGSIVLLHDGLDGNPHANRSVLLRAMPLILAGLKEKGLEPVRLDRMLGGPAYTRC